MHPWLGVKYLIAPIIIPIYLLMFEANSRVFTFVKSRVALKNVAKSFSNLLHYLGGLIYSIFLINILVIEKFGQYFFAMFPDFFLNNKTFLPKFIVGNFALL